MNQNNKPVEDLDRVSLYCRSVPNVYGGYRLSKDGYIEVWFTRNVDEHAARLRRLLEDPERLRAMKSGRTHEELRAIVARISTDMDKLATIGINIQGVGIGRGAAIVVEVFEPRADTEEILRQRYGDVVIVEPSKGEYYEL